MYTKSRRSAAKVKTGCKTCKIRRVKCDEKKPNCIRCTSTGRQCDGYPSPSEDYHVQVWQANQLGILRKAVSTYSGFGSGIHYLEFYHHCARPRLSTAFDNEFWSRITLQMAHSEPSVRHALIALGYLHSTETGSMRHARSRFAGHHESKTLLFHYNKAVRSLVDRISETSYSPEVGLVTCLLFVCMEYLRGNYHTAFQHLTNGYKVISEYQKKQQLSRRTLSSTQNSLASKTPETSTFFPSAVIDNDLRPIFVRAVASALMYGVEVDTTLDIPKPSLEYYQQLHITSIREAQLSAFELRNQVILKIRNLSRRIFHDSERPLTPQERAEQVLVLQCQRSWLTALETYAKKQQLSTADHLVISGLMTHYHATYIWLACAHEVRQTPFDDHLEGFQQILKHARLILDSSKDLDTGQPTARFTFEISLIPALYFVATRCRCPTTRREALVLLSRNPPREGLWDAEQHVVVTRRVIEIEEEKVEPTTGWPVESTRLWSSVIDANMDQNGGFWAYFLPSCWVHEKTDDGKQKLRQEFFVM
ncbi:hypothetical protein FB567DRAFT_446714 [Paraphoma chrysanthemicola]|uniref:Zn(2)-C6 fungal-type domain-containing protein n=1 Tax=Paraphoma chrysanthemicola TaxID=798071 RepID=A0A8K0VX72_9PLEO|nr:hypothetical protein FB567DRAFT_446714 [Paraphoma chrysanthemicola]